MASLCFLQPATDNFDHLKTRVLYVSLFEAWRHCQKRRCKGPETLRIKLRFLRSLNTRALACRELGVSGWWLEAGYTDHCFDETWSGFLVLAIPCAFVYALGIPLFFYLPVGFLQSTVSD